MELVPLTNKTAIHKKKNSPIENCKILFLVEGMKHFLNYLIKVSYS